MNSMDIAKKSGFHSVEICAAARVLGIKFNRKGSRKSPKIDALCSKAVSAITKGETLAEFSRKNNVNNSNLCTQMKIRGLPTTAADYLMFMAKKVAA